MKVLTEKFAESPVWPRVLPFFLFLVLTSAQAWFGEAGRYWFYAAKCVVGVWLILLMRPFVKEMRWAFSWEAVVVGVLVCVMWVGLDPYYPKMGGGGGADLRLMSVNDPAELPGTGGELVVVARNATDDTLHFKAFDHEGEAVVDSGEADYPGKSSDIAALKDLLNSLSEKDTPSRDQEDAILDAVASITGHTQGGGPWNPFALFGEGALLAWFFVVVRIVGSSLVVPPLEETFYRSFVYRYVAKPDFNSVPLNFFSWTPMLVTCGIFGLVHHQWLAGFLCGLAYQWLVIRKNRLGDAMTAHAITNFLLGLWVVWRPAWQFW